MDDTKVSRRDLLRSAALAGAGLGLTPDLRLPAPPPPAAVSGSMLGVPFEARPLVRLALIGVGGRGTSMLPIWLALDGVQVTAVCDIVEDKVRHAQALVTQAGQKSPAGYFHGEHDFENLCRRDDVDFVYIATPWEWHVPMALAALAQGKHCGTEVPAATTIEDCWKLVRASERHRRHCLIMENTCYGYNEMLVLNMIRAGVLGDILHGEGAYLHDLRGELFSNQGEGLWRRTWSTRDNGNLYPTHGLGPVAQYMDIHRGDRFDYLVSMSSPARGLAAYRAAHIPPDDPKWKETYVCGDINVSLIKTVQGRTIILQHDTSNARPYDRLNTINGTKGVFRDFPPRLYLDGENPEAWTTIDQVKTQYEHPLWSRIGELARKLGGHGGMDFLMAYRLAECLHHGLPPDIDVYDAAAWSAPMGLSVASVAHGSAPMAFPDFTAGHWKDRKS